MEKQHFIQAIEIITEYHNNGIVLNSVKSGGQVSPVLESPTIHITDCCAAVVNKLIAAGFSLSASKDGIRVDKY